MRVKISICIHLTLNCLSKEGENEDGLIMSKAANIWNLMQATPHRHTHYKPWRKLHLSNNDSEWKGFFFHSSSLMDGKMCRCGFSLIWECICFIWRGLGCVGLAGNRQSQSLSTPDPEIVQVTWRSCLDLSSFYKILLLIKRSPSARPITQSTGRHQIPLAASGLVSQPRCRR